MKNLFLILLVVLSLNSFSKVSIRYETFNWNGIEVVWVEDKKFPVYDVIIYFGEGALADDRNKDGLVSMTFDLMGNGTHKYSQKELSEKLDFYATSVSSSVTHEYSTVSYAGLVKDIVPVTELVCHMIQSSIYPEEEIKSYKTKLQSSLNNMVVNKSALANRIFRNVSLGATPFSSFVEGSLKSLKKIDRKSLRGMNDYFNNKVYKKIFISGPADVLKVRKAFIEKCAWTGGEKFRRSTQKREKYSQKESKENKVLLYFAGIDGANQAQIRVGNYLEAEKFASLKYDLSQLASTVLGGSFTSLLMQELRVKRGLTYGAYSAAASQALYGRSVITTSTKNESLLEALYTIRDTLKMLKSSKVPEEKVTGSKRYLVGKHLLQYEKSSSFLANLVLYDHLGKRYSDLQNFTDNIDRYEYKEVIKQGQELFDWESQIVFVLGDHSLLNQIKKSQLFEVKEVKVKDFL